MSETGGEAPCSAHLLDESATTFDEAAGSRPDDGISGVVWSLPHGGGLDANIVRLAARGEIGEHVNDQVDVLLVVWSGHGELVVDEQRVPLRPGTVAPIAAGTRRRIVAGDDGVTYLSTHPSRGPMTVGLG